MPSRELIGQFGGRYSQRFGECLPSLLLELVGFAGAVVSRGVPVCGGSRPFGPGVIGGNAGYFQERIEYLLPAQPALRRGLFDPLGHCRVCHGLPVLRTAQQTFPEFSQVQRGGGLGRRDAGTSAAPCGRSRNSAKSSAVGDSDVGMRARPAHWIRNSNDFGTRPSNAWANVRTPARSCTVWSIISAEPSNWETI